jgi:spore coat polysaccharide biosynthesis protein SpsF
MNGRLTTSPQIVAFIQARMSSHRFPGKVLAPFRGSPLITSVIKRVRTAVGPDVSMVVLTSLEPSDDPVESYLNAIGQTVFRGPLANVVKRFQLASERWPSEWVMRVNADSPLLEPSVVRAVLSRMNEDADLVTTTFPRTFPKGQNVELIRRDKLMSLEASRLDDSDREHVTRYFYQHAHDYRIVNVDSGNVALADLDMTIDTVDDLNRLEALSSNPVVESFALSGWT